MKKAIILFVRHPELGKVKTRLAREIGEEAALKIYVQLLEHTHAVTNHIACDKFVFYTNHIAKDDIWDNEHFVKRVQSGHDLGERMFNAFQELFISGYDRVIIIGSDCPGISAEIISQGFQLLDKYKVVLGPAVDGGYYLLGLELMVPELFSNKKWSTGSVLQDTLADLRKKGISYSLLPELRDIDTHLDLIELSYPLPD